VQSGESMNTPPAHVADPASGEFWIDPLSQHSIANKWQLIVDTVANIIGVPAGLIMRVRDDKIQVAVSSRTQGNPYHVGDAEHLECSGLYCETVIASRDRLIVTNALVDEHWRENPDIELGMIAYLGYPICWPDGRPFGTLCALDSKENHFGALYDRLLIQFRDVIEHHLELVSRALSSEQRLNEEKKAAEESMQAARAELTRANRFAALGELAGPIVHEINQPLTAILSNADTALKWLRKEKPDAAKAEASLERVRQSTKATIELISNVRAQARGRTPVMRDVLLDDVVRSACSLLRSEVRKAGAVLELGLAAHGSSIHADHVQIEQVVVNLLRNAVQAVGEIGNRTRRVRVSTFERDGSLTLVIDDNGPGIPSAQAAEVFEPLYTTKAAGMGLGLSICRSIVMSHGGSIELARHEAGSGVSARVILPRI
jgi:signal transduction histidine kinase